MEKQAPGRGTQTRYLGGAGRQQAELGHGGCEDTGRAPATRAAELSLALPRRFWKQGRCFSRFALHTASQFLGTKTEACFRDAVHLYTTHWKPAIARGICIAVVTSFEICKINKEKNPNDRDLYYC